MHRAAAVNPKERIEMRKSTKQTTSEIHATTVARLLNRSQHELAATIQADLDVRDEDVFVVSQRLSLA